MLLDVRRIVAAKVHEVNRRTFILIYGHLPASAGADGEAFSPAMFSKVGKVE